MPPIQRTCIQTGRTFEVSELEQKLRQEFGLPLPDTHPTERLRWLMVFRNISTLYNDVCDLCGKRILSVWGENPTFPVYCPACFSGDGWTPAEKELDLNRSFFDQYQELCDLSPHLSQNLLNPVNSDFCNQGTSLKNCYMTFNVTRGEDCYYVYGGMDMKNSVDTILCDNSEYLYSTIGCRQSYQVFWSEYAINCHDCYFVYDCVDSSNCALSTGLRHAKNVFLNEQLTPEAYQAKVQELQTGSYAKVQEYLAQFETLKQAYPKKYLVGNKNEQVTGNIIFESRNIVDGYFLLKCEDSANLFNVWNTKDSLDVVGFGGRGMEKVFSSATIGHECFDVRYSVGCYVGCHSFEYCQVVIGGHDNFGCAYAKKLEYSILNKQYASEEYKRLVGELKRKMTERGEYGQMYRADMLPFAYNESFAQMVMPLTQAEAEARGFRWYEKPIPQVPASQIFTPPDSIDDVTWEQVSGKVLICQQSQRPFKLVQPEFEFYKKFHLPLPRIHPEVRIANRYPREMMFSSHSATCSRCQTEIQTSMPAEDRILCENCYQQAMVG